MEQAKYRTLRKKLKKPKSAAHSGTFTWWLSGHVRVKKLTEWLECMLFDRRSLPTIRTFLIFAEIILCIFLIENRPYTEIDWKAYMQEVGGFYNGTTDYYELKGDTGPLVYPGGFVYIFLALYHVTNAGVNIRFAQYIFAVFYIITLYLVFRLYEKSLKVPPFVLILSCCVSYRVHSIYMLRLFNDPVAMMFFYAALNAFISDEWTLGSLLYSVAVSVKMNILLFAPALLLAYIACLSWKGTLKQLFVCGVVQCCVAVPFILVNPVAYLSRSFNFGRVFLSEWSVNWGFLPNWIFSDYRFHIALLACHAILLGNFYKSWYNRFIAYRTLKSVCGQLGPKLMKKYNKEILLPNPDPASQLFLLPFFACNFIGMACSRSLHYQFYAWYYHSLPFVLWSTPFKDSVRLLVMCSLEFCWCVYPPIIYASLILHACHGVVIWGLFRNRYVGNMY